MFRKRRLGYNARVGIMGRSWFRTAKVSIGMSRFAVAQNTPGAPAEVSIRKGVWGIPLNTEPTFCEAVRPNRVGRDCLLFWWLRPDGGNRRVSGRYGLISK